jgi:hypothetical protein
VTEKIDGTNGLIEIERGTLGSVLQYTADGSIPTDRVLILDESEIGEDGLPVYEWHVRAGSRNRWLTPENDNHGFARWVWDNAKTLVADLGEGRHYGEWYGAGIQRGYGLAEKHFMLFNVIRWADVDFTTPNLEVATVLSAPDMTAVDLKDVPTFISALQAVGSFHVPGYMNPEGVVIYHHAARQLFKVTVKDDEGKWTQEKK